MADAPLTPDRLAELRRLSDAERAAWEAHERCPATTPDGYVNVSGLGATGGAWGEAHAAWRAALEVSGHELLDEVDRLRAALAPFALWASATPTDGSPQVMVLLSVADLRRAAEALVGGR